AAAERAGPGSRTDLRRQAPAGQRHSPCHQSAVHRQRAATGRRCAVHRLRGAVGMAYEAILSQDEVDALLAGVTGEDSTAKETSGPEGEIRPYDLGSPERIVRRRMHALEAINEHFARNMRSSLLSFMRRSADITVGAIKVQKYGDFERNLPVPSNLNLINMKPLRGTALFSFDPNLVFLVID